MAASDSTELRVLDKGFVRLVDNMGGDSGVVQAARVSYAGISKGEEKDKGLISFLLKNQHLTPFEHAVFKFHVKCPIFVARQWFRHRFAAYNEISFRYTEAPEEFYIPVIWRAQDSKNKQGSVKSEDINHRYWSNELQRSCDGSMDYYRRALAEGMAREMARMFLPVNLYTEFFWTVNTRSLINFLSLRADSHAQSEIQEYALALNQFFKEKMPWTHSSFINNVWKGENIRMDPRLPPEKNM